MKLFAKSPMQLRREADAATKSSTAPLPSAPFDPLKLPQLEAERPHDVRATSDWLAHIHAGRIEVR